MKTSAGFGWSSPAALVVVIAVLIGVGPAAAGPGTPEVCNGAGAACSVGTAACLAVGISKCTADGLGTRCCVDDGDPQAPCTPLESEPSDLLSNGGMESDGNTDGVPDDWLGFGLSNDARKCDRPAQTFAHIGTCAFRFNGEPDGATEELRQVRAGVTGRACDTLTLRAWARGKKIPADATVRLRLQLRRAGSLVRTFALKLAHGSFAYDRFRRIFTAPSAYDEVRVKVEYDGTKGKLVVDDVSLTRRSIDNPGPGPTQQCTVTKDADGFFQLTAPNPLVDYWVRLPAAYDVAHPQPTRLLVGLHGCGDTAHNFATFAVVPFSLRATQDYIGISLGGRDAECWNLAVDGAKVAAAIAHVRSCFYVHQKEIVIGGYDFGGELAYDVGLKNAATYAGILVENSELSLAVGAANVDAVLAAAAWPINVAHTARLDDAPYPIADVRGDRDKMLAAGIDLEYRELPGNHDASSDDWSEFLLPAMAKWWAP